MHNFNQRFMEALEEATGEYTSPSKNGWAETWARFYCPSKTEIKSIPKPLQKDFRSNAIHVIAKEYTRTAADGTTETKYIFYCLLDGKQVQAEGATKAAARECFFSAISAAYEGGNI